MKKYYIFCLSFFSAFAIYFYARMPVVKMESIKKYSYQTFTKGPNRTIASHDTTKDEFSSARINTTKSIKDVTPDEEEKTKEFIKNFPIRSGRLVIGDNSNEYEDENKSLEMTNSINKEWKSILGLDLLKFQDEDTKVIIREEFPVIKVFDNKGQYLEQVIITFMLKNGDKNSFRAFVNSETGFVVETWDRTIHEKARVKSIDLGAVPLETMKSR